MTPEQLAKADTEYAHQCALFCYAQQQIAINPLWALLFAIPNGAMLGDDAKSRAIRGMRLKTSGLKPGVPDTCLPVPMGDFHGLYVELKTPEAIHKTDGGLSADQKKIIKLLQSQNYCVRVCYGWKDAANQIELYLASDDE